MNRPVRRYENLFNPTRILGKFTRMSIYTMYIFLYGQTLLGAYEMTSCDSSGKKNLSDFYLSARLEIQAVEDFL